MDEVRQVICSLLPDTRVRKSCLEIFGESVSYANSFGRDKWGAYYETGKVRLLVGSLIVVTIHKNGMWLALDQELLDTSQQLSAFLDNAEEWKWDDYDYPVYKSVPSRNGFYSPSTNHLEVWNVIKKLNFEVIAKTAAKYEKLRHGSKHSEDLIAYIQSEIGNFLEFPRNEHSEVSEAVEVLQEISGKPRRFSGQGFQSSPEVRRVVELRAMNLATEYFQEQGWVVEDTSRYESYDLRCTRSKEEVYVEVKGTTSAGSKILMTYQEVLHTKKNYPNTALFAVSQIKLNNSEDALEASGGEIGLYMPWLLNDDDLKAIAYEYQVPVHNAV
jgi:Domain of unknown function (DUF3883)